MSDLTRDALLWLRPTSEGLLGLSGGMSGDEVGGTLGELRTGFLPNPSLRLLEGFGKLPDGTLTEHACVLRDGRLFEARAYVKLYQAAPKRALVDGIAAALDGVATVATPKRKWTAGNATFQLSASSDDVLEEGMPIDVQISVQWTA